MACTQIPIPASTSPATADWQKELAMQVYMGGEARKFRLTNWSTSLEPQVEIGSRFEVNGSFYSCSANEDITGWTGISNATYCYVYATASAGTVTFSYSATAPTYSAALGGLYNGTARALFKIYRTDATHWDNKRYADTKDDNVAKSDVSLSCSGNASTVTRGVYMYVGGETIQAGTYLTMNLTSKAVILITYPIAVTLSSDVNALRIA